MDPRTFKPDFDIVSELINNRDEYTGGSNFTTIYGFPHYLQTSINRITLRVKKATDSRPGMGTAVSCCVSYGLSMLASNSAVEKWLAIKSELDSAGDNINAEGLEEVSSLLDGFRVSVPDGMGTGNRKLSISMPDEVKISLHSLAFELSVSQSSLGVFSVMLALSTQRYVLPAMRDLQNQAVDGFTKKLMRRVRTAKLLIAGLEME
jgi:hypothetical protein